MFKYTKFLAGSIASVISLVGFSSEREEKRTNLDSDNNSSILQYLEDAIDASTKEGKVLEEEKNAIVFARKDDDDSPHKDKA